MAACAPQFLIRAEGFETLITPVFRDVDPYLESDVEFGVRSSLVRTYEQHAPGTGLHTQERAAYRTLDYGIVQKQATVAPAEAETAA